MTKHLNVSFFFHFLKRTNSTSLWFLPDLFIGLFYWTGTHGQHDGPSLGCGDGDDHHSGQDQDVYLENQEVKSKTQTCVFRHI